MDDASRRAMKRAIDREEMVAVTYAKPGAGTITRHVRPYEFSVNQAGRRVVWGTDSVHGPEQIHAFRSDRIVSVRESKQPTKFQPTHEVARHLRSFNK